MATKGTEVEILGAGIKPALEKDLFLLNMERWDGYLPVRDGFGQVVQFDTTINAKYNAFGSLSVRQGELKHHGSESIRTGFGHEQVVSIFSQSVYTGNTREPLPSYAPPGQFVRLYVVAIYDATTGELWEEPIYTGTPEKAYDNIEKAHGQFETTLFIRHDDYVVAGDDRFFFLTHNNTLYFGSKRTGLMAYLPASFNGTRWQQLEGSAARDWHHKGPSESCLVRKVSAVDGEAVGYIYLTRANYPKPPAVAMVGDQMVLARGREIWFANLNMPGAIISDNVVLTPLDDDVVALQGISGDVLVFGSHQTYLYQPNDGSDLKIYGRWHTVSDTVGCLGPNAVRRTKAGVVWADAAGVYLTTNGYEAKRISDPIDDFWHDGLSDPRTYYAQASGATSLVNEQPMLMCRPDDDAHVVYDHVRDAVHVVYPERNLSLVWENGWAVWSFESSAAALGTVRAYQNVMNPWLVMGDEWLYCVGSPQEVSCVDMTSFAGSTPTHSGKNASWYLLRYGRGGALDRNAGYAAVTTMLETREDRRLVTGAYVGSGTEGAVGFSFIYIDPWIPVPEDTVFPGGTTAPARCYLLPVSVVPNFNLAQPDRIFVYFTFDNTKWNFATVGATNAIDALLPSERIASAAGFTVGLYDSGTGLPDPAGDVVGIYYNGADSTGMYAPEMNLIYNAKNPLVYLPMYYSGLATDFVASAGIEAVAGGVQLLRSGGGYVEDCMLYAWQQAYVPGRVDDDTWAQPVDWCVKSGQIGADKGEQIKLRGVYLKLLSHGVADDPKIAAPWAQLSVGSASDFKDWSGQIVDHTGGAIQTASDVEPLRDRMSPTSGILTRRTFSNLATWGSDGAGSYGNYLICDPEYNTIAVSERVRGEHVSVILYGSLLNRAEELRLSSAKAVIKPLAGRRRRGR